MNHRDKSIASIVNGLKPESAAHEEIVSIVSTPSGETKQFVYYETGFQLHPDGTLEGANSENMTDSSMSVEERKRNRLSRFFEENSFRHILVLTGAGTSTAVRGKTREGLWDACRSEIESVKVAASDRSFPGTTKNDIEQFLSFAVQVANVDVNNEQLASAIFALKTKIRTECDLSFSSECQSDCHETLLRKLTARKPTLPRVEIFTTNYDTLFEQAAKKAGFIVIDGFSFSFPRTFSGRLFDLDIVNRERTRLKEEDNFVPNVFHLMKLHGSVDWIGNENGLIEQRELRTEEEPLIVYPSSEKYAISYEQPFFEMMLRFQTALRKDNTLLIVLGFGFADKHINSAIIEAVEQNPGFHLLIVDYAPHSNAIDLDKYRKQFASIGDNISIVFASFAEFVDLLPANKLYAARQPDFVLGKQQGAVHGQAI